MTSQNSPSMSTRLRTYAEIAFGIDLRSLALVRIGTALLVLGDLTSRAFDLRAFYTDSGVLPRLAHLDLEWDPTDFSIHLMSGLAAWQAILFVVAGVFGVMLLVGYRTRLATVASCFLLASLHYRNPLIVSGADAVLYLLLFWGLFLPWGARASLDSLRRPVPAGSRAVLSFGSFGLLLQIACIWTFSALQKGDSWYPDGTAIQYALMIDDLDSLLTALIKPFHGLSSVATTSVYFWELLGPALLFVPFLSGWIRFLGMLGFVALNVGISLMLDISLFPWVNSVSLLAFLPSSAWEALGTWLARRGLSPRLEAAAERLRALGQRLVPPTSSPTGGRGPWPAPLALLWNQVLPAFLALYVLSWNLANHEPFDDWFPERLEGVGHALGIDQQWSMFANPTVLDGWAVVVGYFESGRELDLVRNRPVSFSKPRDFEVLYESFRWRRYFEDMWSSARVGRLFAGDTDHLAEDSDPYLELFVRYLCDRDAGKDGWSSDQDELVEVEVFLMLEETTPDFVELPPVPTSIFFGDCP